MIRGWRSDEKGIRRVLRQFLYLTGINKVKKYYKSTKKDFLTGNLRELKIPGLKNQNTEMSSVSSHKFPVKNAVIGGSIEI